MRKLIGGVAAGTVVAAGAAAVIFSGGSAKPSVNDIGAADATGSNPVYIALSTLGGDADPALDGNGTATSTTGMHKVLDYSVEQVQTIAISSQTAGAGAGKMPAGVMSFSLPVDAAYGAMFKSAAAGTPAKFVRLEYQKSSGGSMKTYMQVTLKLVALTHLTLLPGPGGAVAKFDLTYGGYQVNYYATQADGSLAATPQQNGWSMVRNVLDNSPTTPPGVS